MMTLEHEMTYRLKTRGPLGTTNGSPIGARQYWEMSEATLTGPRINAKLGMPGGDWTPDAAPRGLCSGVAGATSGR